jgi:O-antigen ligase
MLGIALAGSLFLLWLADPEFIQRQQTTTNAQGNSAQSRLAMWRAGWEMVKDYPLGAGGRAFHILSPRYIPEVLEKTNSEERSSHNTYVQLATEWGVQGTILYLLFIGTTFGMLHRIRNRASGNDWYFYRSLAIQVGLIGTWTAGMFSNRLYGESIYWMCALAFALYRVQSTELASEKVESPVEVQEAARAIWHPAPRPQELPAK